MNSTISEYCVGCGLCQACSKATIKVDNKGFFHPEEGDEEWLSNICPSMHDRTGYYDVSSIWGRREAVYYGWSNDANIRKSASSGGIISETAIYLLKSNKVDSIIHICADSNDQTQNIVTLSSTTADVIRKCGSRYSISHPLEIITKIDLSKRYAFIGKPCDIVALKNYIEINPKIGESILVFISFFCMGLPSEDAQERLMKELNTDRDKCVNLSYRGHGWPGYTTAINYDGTINSMEYSFSWGKILGRDVMKVCKLCIDGIGEAADISCADAWYVRDNKPDFSEHEGRNIVFARSKLGNDILLEMNKSRSITLETLKNEEEYLKMVQWSQFLRRATLFSRIQALKFMKKAYPDYPKMVMKNYGKKISAKEKISAFFGTYRRLAKGNF